jgi:STE24 endopeptidase
MNVLGSAFVAAVGLQVGLRLWLSRRQMAAVRAHRDRVPAAFIGSISLEEQHKAADYTVTRARFAQWGIVVDGLIKILLTVGGGLALINTAVSGFLRSPEIVRETLVVLVVFVILQCAALPLDLWRTFKIEGRFGFNRTTLGLYSADLAKSALLALTLMIPVVLGVLSLMAYAGRAWWLYAWALWIALSIGLTWLAPRFIAPLFNRFTPIEDLHLKARITAMLARCGFTADGGVYVMDSSRRTAHGNAHFSGIGRNKRIVLYDTLLSRIEADEVEAVLAHELGHFRLRHVQSQLLLSAAFMLASMALLGFLARTRGFYVGLGASDFSPATALLLFTLVAPVLTFFGKPLRSWWLRRQERAADDFAVKHVPADRLAGALIKLYRDNASTLTPDWVYTAFYDSHPPAVERINRLVNSTSLA